MKLSRFTTDIELDREKNMLYNTASRQYYVYSKVKGNTVQNLLKNMNSGVYDKDEIGIIEELLKKKIVVADEADEIID